MELGSRLNQTLGSGVGASVPLADPGTSEAGDICHDNVDQWLLTHPDPEDEWRNAPGEVKR